MTEDCEQIHLSPGTVTNSPPPLGLFHAAVHLTLRLAAVVSGVGEMLPKNVNNKIKKGSKTERELKKCLRAKSPALKERVCETGGGAGRGGE